MVKLRVKAQNTIGLCGSDWSFSLLLCACGDINHWQTRYSPTYSFLYCELSKCLISFITGETTKVHKKHKKQLFLLTTQQTLYSRYGFNTRIMQTCVLLTLTNVAASEKVSLSVLSNHMGPFPWDNSFSVCRYRSTFNGPASFDNRCQRPVHFSCVNSSPRL